MAPGNFSRLMSQGNNAIIHLEFNNGFIYAISPKVDIVYAEACPQAMYTW